MKTPREIEKEVKEAGEKKDLALRRKTIVRLEVFMLYATPEGRTADWYEDPSEDNEKAELWIIEELKKMWWRGRFHREEQPLFRLFSRELVGYGIRTILEVVPDEVDGESLLV